MLRDSDFRPRCVLWALFRWSEIKKRQWSLKPDGTHGDGSSGKQAVDEAEEDVLGVLRVALDAQHVLADAEHLDARLVGGGQHLRALRHLPHLLAMTKNAISRLQRCTWECRRYTTRTLLVLVDLGDLGAARQLAALAQRVEEPARRQRRGGVRDGHLPDADVPKYYQVFYLKFLEAFGFFPLHLKLKKCWLINLNSTRSLIKSNGLQAG